MSCSLRWPYATIMDSLEIIFRSNYWPLIYLLNKQKLITKLYFKSTNNLFITRASSRAASFWQNRSLILDLITLSTNFGNQNLTSLLSLYNLYIHISIIIFIRIQATCIVLRTWFLLISLYKDIPTIKEIAYYKNNNKYKVILVYMSIRVKLSEFYTSYIVYNQSQFYVRKQLIW